MSDPRPQLSWSDFVHELAELLRARAIETPLFLVGGAVRDAYLRRPITDIDIAVDGDAIGLARQAADWLVGDIYVMDRVRAVARVLVTRQGERIHLDFARFRGDTLEEDLRKRDFSMNAMAVDLRGDLGELIDPLGGIADLRRKALRCCSSQSLTDDPVRMLRAVRLSAQFDLKIHPDAAAEIRARSAALSRVSGERARDELFKLLGLERSARALRVLLHMNLLQTLIAGETARGLEAERLRLRPETWDNALAVTGRMSALLTAISSKRTDNTAAAFDLGMLVIQLDRFRPALQAHLAQQYGGARSQAELLVLAALLHDRAQVDIDLLFASLKLSVAEEQLLRRAVANHERIGERKAWNHLELHRFWYAFGAGGIDAILLACARYLGVAGSELKQRDWLAFVDNVTSLLDSYYNRYDEVVDPALLLNGNDIRRLCQLAPGPLVGQILTALREAQVTGEVHSADEAADFVVKRAAILRNSGGSRA